MRPWVAMIALSSVLVLPVMAQVERERPLEVRETRLSESERIHRAEAWGLNLDEWDRYETLIQGPRGLWSPSLDPIMVLGIHARNDAERRRFAERAVEQERTRVEGELAFQRAYDEAWARLYPEVRLLEPTVMSPETTSLRSMPFGTGTGPRVLLFTQLAECPACDRLLAAVLARVEQQLWGLDIYLLDTRPVDDAAVRVWASERNVPLERVRARQITLNHDQGMAARLGFWQPAPFLAVATEEGARVIALADVR